MASYTYGGKVQFQALDNPITSGTLLRWTTITSGETTVGAPSSVLLSTITLPITVDADGPSWASVSFTAGSDTYSFTQANISMISEWVDGNVVLGTVRSPLSQLWQASTYYFTGQMVHWAGVLYRVTADFTSGSSFSSTYLTPILGVPVGVVAAALPVYGYDNSSNPDTTLDSLVILDVSDTTGDPTGTLKIIPMVGVQSLAGRPISQGSASSTNITPGEYVGIRYQSALAADPTINVPQGSPTNGQRLTIRLKDNGTGRLLSWATAGTAPTVRYRAVGVTLPTTTVANKTVYIEFVYNAQDYTWDAIQVNQEL